MSRSPDRCSSLAGTGAFILKCHPRTRTVANGAQIETVVLVRNGTRHRAVTGLGPRDNASLCRRPCARTAQQVRAIRAEPLGFWLFSPPLERCRPFRGNTRGSAPVVHSSPAPATPLIVQQEESRSGSRRSPGQHIDPGSIEPTGARVSSNEWRKRTLTEEMYYNLTSNPDERNDVYRMLCPMTSIFCERERLNSGL